MIVRVHQCRFIKHGFPLNSLPLIIMKLQKTFYSHYAMSYIFGNTEYFAHSSYPVTRQMDEVEFKKTYTLVKTYEFNLNVDPSEFLDFLAKNYGKLYSLSQLVGIFLRIVKIAAKNPFGKGQKHLICNEFVILFINRFLGVNILDTDDYDLNDTERLLDGIQNIRAN